jgi:osmotically-inducible protein OsmY
MSDWYRGGRNDQFRYGEGGRERESGGRDRWSERNGYGPERRSFDEGGAGYASRYGGARYGDYGGGSGGGGYGDQGWRGGEGGQRDAWRAEQGRGWSPRSEGYGGQGYGREDYGGRQAYGAQGYGGASTGGHGWRGSSYERGMGGDYGAGYGYAGGSGYGGEQGMSRQGYGRTGGAGGGQRAPFDEGNRYVQGVTDTGDERHFGEHRGRGPKNYTRSDERIREDVNDRLTDHPRLDAGEIEVQVKDCEVTLTGTVTEREDKRRAEDIAENVSGVKHVQNNLRVQPRQDQRQGAPATSGQTAGQAGHDGRGAQGRAAGTA